MKQVIRAAFMVAALASSFATLATTSPPPDRAAVADIIRSEVADIVAGINAHDIDRATHFDSPDIVSMEGGRPPSTGLASEREGLGMTFKHAPSWRLELVDDTVDVAESGEMAVYRSTYNETTVDDGVAMTHKVNFIAGLARQGDGSWQVTWSVVAAQERSHPQ